MSVVTPSLPQGAAALPSTVAPVLRADVNVENKIIIPGWITSLDEYRRWAESDAYPQQACISYLNGTIWVDAAMEEFLSHNQLKHAFNLMFGVLFASHPEGRFVPDRMLLVNTTANLSTEPDGLFYLWETMKSGRLRLVPGKLTGYTQLEGTPDGVLEIVSDSSETKDLVQLRELYWKAGVPEYWLVDARGADIRFDILRHTEAGYVPSLSADGWPHSHVLARAFQIERGNDPLGLAQFVVRIMELAR